MLTKEDKTMINNVWDSNKYGAKRLNFQTINGASVVLRTFTSDCDQRGPLNEHPVVDVRTRRALLRMLTLWGTWSRARRINPRHTAPLDRSHESSEYLRQIIGDDFFMAALCNRGVIIFLPCSFFLLLSFFYLLLLFFLA